MKKYMSVFLLLFAMSLYAGPPPLHKPVDGYVVNVLGDSTAIWLVTANDTVWLTPAGLYWEPATTLDSALLDSVHDGLGRFGGGGAVLWTKTGTNLSPTTAGDDVLLNTGETFSIADMTTGSVPFFGASGLLSQDNANLFWDDTNNKFGIDVNSPSSALHIKANVPGTVGSHPAGQLIIQDPDDAVFGNVVITAYESDGAGNPDQQLWYIGSSSVSNSDITFLNRRGSNLYLGTNGASRLTIDAGGNVGIGQTSPDEILHLFANNAALKLEDDGGNDATINVGNSQLCIASDPDDLVASSDICFDIDGAEVARFHQSTNFGIGTLSPSERLTVVGNIEVSGTVDTVDVAALAAKVHKEDLKYYMFNLADPDALYAVDAEWSIDPRTAQAITIDSFTVRLNADTTT